MNAHDFNKREFFEAEGEKLTGILSATRETFGSSLSAYRPWPVIGDMMEPVLKRGDLLLCRPVTEYVGFGVYLLGEGAIYKVDRDFGHGLRLMPSNERYRPHTVSYEAFDRGVLAKVDYAITALGGKPVPGAIELGIREWRH